MTELLPGFLLARLRSLPPGPKNAITDVPGVRVGHATLISGEGALKPGAGPVRTGVSVILPHSENLYLEKVPAAVHTINGFGKVVGFEQVRELGVLEAPVALTNTLNVGKVLDALVEHTLAQNPELGINPALGSVNIVVGETNDGYLNDIRGRHVRCEHVYAALENASGETPDQGAVGAGTGTVCFGWKGGIGSASRVLPASSGGFTLGALVQSNFGSPADLVIAGVPVGRRLPLPAAVPASGAGSVMIVLATDAPLAAHGLGRLCARAAAGLARTGSYLHHGSGDFVIAFSVAGRTPPHTPAPAAAQFIAANEASTMNLLFRAVIETVEEAVLHSLFAAETVAGRDGHIAHRLPSHLLSPADWQDE